RPWSPKRFRRVPDRAGYGQQQHQPKQQAPRSGNVQTAFQIDSLSNSQRRHRIYPRGAPRRDEAGRQRHRDEQQWSPVVYYDRPRCILCYRCVRACGEGMDVWALGVANRGINSTIIPNHGDHLECEECGNCIDICPVGALTSGIYRYQTRPWEMNHVGAICTFCGDGCKTTLGVRNDRVVRGDNRDKSGINGDFLCVKGRYGLDFTQHKDRLTQPLLRMDGELKPVSWAFALQTIAAKWKELGPGSVGVIGSTRALNEEAFTLRKFAREVLATPHLDHHRSADFPTLLSHATSFAALADLKTAPVVLLVGGNPTEEHPLVASNIRWGYRLHKTKLYVLNRNEIKLRRQAFRYARVDDEAAAIRFLNGAGAANAAPLTGVAEASEKRWPQTPVSEPQTLGEGLQDFRARLQQEQDVIVVISPGIAGEDLRQLIAFGSGLSGQTRYILLGDNSNARGASDMGLYPGEGGMNSEQMVLAAASGKLASLYVTGANPLRLFPHDLTQTFLVVQDLFLTETAQAATVVLPALSAYEKAGTVTNTAGEIQLQPRAGGFEGAKSDLEILHKLALLLGSDWGAANPERTLQQIRTTVPGYNVSLAKLMSGEAVMSGARSAGIPRGAQHEAGSLHPNHDTLFTAGTLGRYSATLNQVLERHLPGLADAQEKTRK
ncbi:MAG: molybdopterin-dependent oxidoreductase, partial [Terriglobales bacterium]